MTTSALSAVMDAADLREMDLRFQRDVATDAAAIAAWRMQLQSGRQI
jgi:hypothetical protein